MSSGDTPTHACLALSDEQSQRDFAAIFASQPTQEPSGLQILLDALRTVEASSTSVEPTPGQEVDGSTSLPLEAAPSTTGSGPEYDIAGLYVLADAATSLFTAAQATPKVVESSYSDDIFPDWKGRTPLYFWDARTNELNTEPLRSLDHKQTTDRCAEVDSEITVKSREIGSLCDRFSSEQKSSPGIEAATQLFSVYQKKPQLRQNLTALRLGAEGLTGEGEEIVQRGLGERKKPNLYREDSLRYVYDKHKLCRSQLSTLRKTMSYHLEDRPEHVSSLSRLTDYLTNLDTLEQDVWDLSVEHFVLRRELEIRSRLANSTQCLDGLTSQDAV